MESAAMDVSLHLLFGRARAAVLKVFHEAANEGAALHLREIARRAELSPSAVQYELRLLSQLDMLDDVGTVNRPLYVLNSKHRLSAGLHSMFSGADEALLADDRHFARKRIQQARDHRRKSRENSTFLTQWGTLANKVKVS